MAKNKPNLRPSGSKRWVSCPGSVSLIQSLVEDGTIKDESSSYADEGSLAHALAAKQLGKDVEYEPEWWDLYYGPEMQGYVDDYVDFVHADVPPEEHNYKVLVEHPVRMFYAPEEPPGTADCIIVDYETKHILIKDLKYGMGVSVRAEDNTQLAIYAMSFFVEHILAEDPEDAEEWSFTLQIYQPRVIGEEAVRQWECSYEELNDTLEDVRKVSKQHLSGEANLPFCPSEDACRFCPAAPVCEAHAQFMFGELPLDPRTNDPKKMPKPETISPDDIARVISIKSQLVKWINKVEAHAKDKLLEGDEIPGYHLVKTLKNRAWSDEEEAVKVLGRQFKKHEYMPPSLVSPTQANKMLKELAKTKKIRPSTFERFEAAVVRDEGNPALAPVDDKREPFLPPTADQEFGDDPSDLL